MSVEDNTKAELPSSAKAKQGQELKDMVFCLKYRTNQMSERGKLLFEIEK